MLYFWYLYKKAKKICPLQIDNPKSMRYTYDESRSSGIQLVLPKVAAEIPAFFLFEEFYRRTHSKNLILYTKILIFTRLISV